MNLGKEDVLESMQPKPVPLVATESQHATTEPGVSQDEVVPWGEGRAEAAMAMERRLRRILDCIFNLVWGWYVVMGRIGVEVSFRKGL